MGIEPLTGPNSRPLLHWQKALLRRVVLFGAFYPQFFYREAINGQIDEREAVKSLCGLDPFTTIRLGGFPSNQPGKAYVRQIKDCLKEIFSKILWHYLKSSCKIPVFCFRNTSRGYMERQDKFRLLASLHTLPPGG